MLQVNLEVGILQLSRAVKSESRYGFSLVPFHFPGFMSEWQLPSKKDILILVLSVYCPCLPSQIELRFADLIDRGTSAARFCVMTPNESVSDKGLSVWYQDMLCKNKASSASL